MEALRIWIRGIIGSRSSLYLLASQVLNIYYAVSREGVAGLRLVALGHRPGPGVWLTFRHLMFPIFIRPGTEDISSLINNVFREEYGRLPRGFSPRTVLDAGAYVGDTAAYFLSRFEKATVVALEPNPKSFHLAKQNLAQYECRAIVLQTALWSSIGSVLFTGHDTGASISDHGIEVQTTAIPALVAQLGIAQFDLVKMDIEGAEAEVLVSGAGSWLRQIEVLMLETHGREIEEVVIPLLEGEGFSIRRHRNVWYCFNQHGGYR